MFDPMSSGVEFSQISGINDDGAVVGTYAQTTTSTHGFLRNPDGTFVSLDAPNAPSSGNTLPVQINSAGAIVGYYLDAQQVFHGFVYE